MARLTIRTAALCRNYQYYAQDVTVIPVLKSNAYGMGMDALVPLLQQQGAVLFGCSRPEEALALRAQAEDVLLLSCIQEPRQLEALARAGVILAVEALEQAVFLNSLGIPVRVHVAVDTGLGRFGFLPAQTEEIKQVFALENITVHGIFSHFVSRRTAQKQFALFTEILNGLEGCPLGIRHIAATATARDPRYQLDAVRIGVGLTGKPHGPEQAFTLTARICAIRHLPKGSRIGYTRQKLKRDSVVAMIDAGTADGAFLYRSCGPRTWLKAHRQKVCIAGQWAPVLGIPGQTHTAIDITGLDCRVGDAVIIDQPCVRCSPALEREYV